MYSTTIKNLLAAVSVFVIPSLALPQSTQPDGIIVPFSTLPQCAALCGPLFDVQGACIPPAQANSCFCGDARLKPFTTSLQGVSQVCGPASCQDAASLQAIQNWYDGYCNTSASATNTAGNNSGSSGSSSGGQSQNANQGWWQGHWKWVVMLIVIVIAIVGGWVGAAFWRKQYLRKKEREIEMRPPVTWSGPPGSAPGAFGYGDGVVDQSTGQPYYNKEATGMTPANNTRQSKGWLGRPRT
ncbi:hypothetical protein F5884DRAFT_817768 [Xylogone sp. PMI_703]|nr:hypothetical protein F5884DRAFT_817768 [Xylogone sp. PMI_703]